MNLLIERLNGEIIDLKEIGIGIRDFVVASPFFNTSYETIEGLPGTVDIGTDIGYRIIRASFYKEAASMESFAVERDWLFAVFRSEEPFYLIDTREPNKRWKVKAYQSFEPDQHGVFMLFDISFTVSSGYAESRTPKTSSYTTGVFAFHNGGNAEINMRAQTETEIEFKGVSTSLTITNVTTGDVWKYNGSTTAGDTLLIKGVRSLKNGNSIFGQTNKKMITFAPGTNEFVVNGSTNFTLTIRTREYFL